jgi:biotin synthase
VGRQDLVSLDELTDAATRAKEQGAVRFCMGAAWRDVPNSDKFDRVLDMVRVVRGLGMEACCTLGMLTQEQADRLAAAGLTAYNHNLDTSPEFYGTIITTRTYDERLETLARVRQAGITVCCGGIIGLGETDEQRAEFAAQLAVLEPDEVPLNFLNPRPGTPFADRPLLDGSEALRVIAMFRLALPRTILRYAGGRELTLGELTTAGMLGGINAVIVGNYLTTLGRPAEADLELLDDLQMPIKALNASL